jgi:hypothetical protein
VCHFNFTELNVIGRAGCSTGVGLAVQAANRENLARKMHGAIHVIANLTWSHAPVPWDSGAIR